MLQPVCRGRSTKHTRHSAQCCSQCAGGDLRNTRGTRHNAAASVQGEIYETHEALGTMLQPVCRGRSTKHTRHSAQCCSQCAGGDLRNTRGTRHNAAASVQGEIYETHEALGTMLQPVCRGRSTKHMRHSAQCCSQCAGGDLRNT